MKKIILFAIAGICYLPSNSPALDLKQAKFTQVVNRVGVISASDKSFHNAAVNDVFKIPDMVSTGKDSRAELVAADGTVTRVGANTIFSYDNANRTIDLQQGSLLFHSPHGNGGGSIHTASATAAVTGTTIIVTATPDGGFKVLDLEGEAEIHFLNGLQQTLEPGQMTIIMPGGTQHSPVLIFRLDSEVKGSLLVSGFDQPLPSIGKIDAEITRQLEEILNNDVGDADMQIDGAPPGQTQVLDFEELNARLNHQRQVTPIDGNFGDQISSRR